MSNFIKVAYGVVSGAGIDTKNMTTEEVVEKFKELSGGDAGWGEKAYGEEKVDKNKEIGTGFNKKEVLNAGMDAGKKFIAESTQYGQKLEKLLQSAYWVSYLKETINKAMFDTNQNIDITIKEVNEIVNNITNAKGNESIDASVNENAKKEEMEKEEVEYYNYLLDIGFNKDEAIQKLKERNETRQRMKNKDKDKPPREITSSAYKRAERIMKRDVENFLSFKK